MYGKNFKKKKTWCNLDGQFYGFGDEDFYYEGDDDNNSNDVDDGHCSKCSLL